MGIDGLVVPVLRTWLGLVLILAGVAKMQHPDSAQRFLSEMVAVLKRYRRFVVFGLSVVEISLGVVLVGGLWPIHATSLAAALLIGSTIVVLPWNHARISGCGCFGALDSGQESARVTLARNVGISLVALGVLIGEYRYPVEGWHWPTLVVALALFSVTVLAYGLLFTVRLETRTRVESQEGGEETHIAMVDP